MFDFSGVSFLLLLVLFLGWLASRAWRVKRPALKWFGVTAAALLTLLGGVLLGAALIGYWKLNRSHDNPVPQLNVAVTPERVARGEQFEWICADCHAPEAEAPMTGKDFLGEDAPPIGDFYAPNLTPVHLADWSDGEVVRARPDGSQVDAETMPWKNLGRMFPEDDELRAIYAHLQETVAASGSQVKEAE